MALVAPAFLNAPSLPRPRLRSASMSELQLPIMHSLYLAESRDDLALSIKQSIRNDSLTSDKSGISDWLADIDCSCYGYSTRATSCPPRLESLRPATEEQENQQPLLTFLENMSTTTQMGPASPMYRSVLVGNGVQIDNTGQKIPAELRDFLDHHILAKRPLELPYDTINRIKDLVMSIESKAEDSVYELSLTEMLPVTRPGAEKEGNLAWNIDCVPNNENYAYAITTPKPNIYLGYSDNAWTMEERAVFDNPVAIRVTRPARRSLFPFLVFELKSESTGGTLWHAENQAAGSGACCVNILRWIFDKAYESQTPSSSVLDTIAFSVCATHRNLLFHVHHYSHTESKNYMSLLTTIDTTHDIQASNHIINNIMDYSMGYRQTRIQEALVLLYPIQRQWAVAEHPAITKASRRIPSREDLAEGPYKKQRLN
jgi:hypothetical protein